ncbi:AAA family ATPase [Kitasatospora sp. MBT63]|uniref:ATP-binding protein n=1 Tax=Kitasatospora sp. MBT63 TaxID=1444768 RepID=UPI0011EA6277|nr:AAA family ATPase [Kitasatospora sp. MBT63]
MSKKDPAMGPDPGGHERFVGRTGELATFGTLAAAVRGGQPWLVVVEGEAGIGKTWLIRRALSDLRGFAVWWARCDPLERDWPYGVVEQWLRGIEPDSLASFAALSGRLAPHTSPVQAGGELLELLATAQGRGPVALVLDDAQWADEVSLRVIGFIVRRLWRDQVMVVLAARTPPLIEAVDTSSEHPADPHEASWRCLVTGAQHTRALRLKGLDSRGVAQLLAASAGRKAPVGAAERLLEHTGGHPLHLHAIIAAATPEQLAGEEEHLPVPDSLADAVRTALAQLKEPSRMLVEALAVLDTCVPLARAARLARIDDPAGALGQALESGLVHWNPDDPTTPVGIRHSLQREAVYQAMDPCRRRTMHNAAAALVDTDTAWVHRVAAADGTDARLAAELESEAGRQLEAEQSDRAATLLLWAADLSTSRTEYERRLLLAAMRLHSLPYHSGTRRFTLQEAVERCAPSPLRSCVLGRAATAHGDFAPGERHYLDAIATARATGDRRTESRARIWLASLYSWQAERPSASLALVGDVLDHRLLDPPARAEARFTLIFATGLHHGPRTALAMSKDILALPDDPARVTREDHTALAVRAMLRLAVGERAAAQRDAEMVLAPTRVETGLATLTARSTLALCHYQAGRWQQSAEVAGHALAQADLEGLLSGLPEAHAWAAMAAAGQGRPVAARSHLDSCRYWSERISPAMYAALPAVAGAVLAQAHADHPRMMDHLDSLTRLPDTGWHRLNRQFELPLYLEALTATGRLAEAEHTLDELRALSGSAPALGLIADWGTGRLAQAHGRLDTAIAVYRRALTRPVTIDEQPFYRARIESDLGHLVLEEGDLQTAAPLLCNAHLHFTALGAAPYAHRVTAALAACGLRPAPGLTRPSGAPPDAVSDSPMSDAHGFYVIGLDLLSAWALSFDHAHLSGVDAAPPPSS